MTQNEKAKIRRRTAQRQFWNRVTGVPNLLLKIAVLVAYFAGAIYVRSKQEVVDAFMDGLVVPAPLIELVCDNLLCSYLLAGAVVIAVLLLYPHDRKMVEDQFQSIGLINSAGLAPKLLLKRRDKEHCRVTVWTFSNPSIPLKTWEDKQLAIEAALDSTVVSMRYGKSKSRVVVRAVSAKEDLPEYIEWQDEYLSKDGFVLTLGEGYVGPITADFGKVSHALLGGETGSGKSVLLKLLLMQSLRKGAEVYIADFKGGVDFPPVWHERCRMCFEEDDLLEMLVGLVDEMERRKRLFKETGYPNLDEYNKAKGTHLKRLVFACDEVAEILDKSGADKMRKDKLVAIEGKLSIIARQGRAFGIHLILATQRPDANLIPGQIRTNLGNRICGRADRILSQIILDSTAAADQISQGAQGRFLLYDGTVFQGYWFDEQKLGGSE